MKPKTLRPPPVPLFIQLARTGFVVAIAVALLILVVRTQHALRQVQSERAARTAAVDQALADNHHDICQLVAAVPNVSADFLHLIETRVSCPLTAPLPSPPASPAPSAAGVVSTAPAPHRSSAAATPVPGGSPPSGTPTGNGVAPTSARTVAPRVTVTRTASPSPTPTALACVIGICLP